MEHHDSFLVEHGENIGMREEFRQFRPGKAPFREAVFAQHVFHRRAFQQFNPVLAGQFRRGEIDQHGIAGQRQLDGSRHRHDNGKENGEAKEKTFH
ncbi:hypothetical protein SDC9_160661 [bioreactor metagenome]|uniref:Uncharacterized protein n=1 Tax=bioreactor metagenome TaxID=1076179 RepID=A0A645FH96_9ZZZZ